MADTDPAGISRVQIGDTAAKTVTANWDDVVVRLSQFAPDATPPSTPGKPTGTSISSTSIDLTWAASTDNESASITYNVYRDAGSVAVGQVVSTSTDVVTYKDTGLTPGSVHTYRVDAVDATNNVSPKSAASDPITVQSGNPAVFSDSFATGNFSAWTANTRLTIDNALGGLSAPSAKMSTTNQSASAYKELPATLQTVCMSANVNVTALNGNALDLLRLRSPGNGPSAKAFISTAGRLGIRSDFSGIQSVSGVSMPSGWHNLELCGAAGTNKAWNLYLDGVKVVNNFMADTDPAGISRVQIGDTAAKTVTANWDDVVVDQAAG